MAYFKLVNGKYRNESSIRNLLIYILNESKNPNNIHNVYGTSKTDIEKIIFHFIKVQELYRKTAYRRILHLIISFPRDCSYTPIDYKRIGYQIVKYYDGYQVIFALHEKNGDGESVPPHIHIAINPINYRTGKKIRFDKKHLKNLHKYVDTICYES